MSDSDWDLLRTVWISASPEWQYRAANFAAYCDPARAIPVLLEMLRVSRDDVYVRVLETLSEFPSDEVLNRLSISDVNLMLDTSASLKGVGKAAADSVMRHFGI